jgi:hypothetical protein
VKQAKRLIDSLGLFIDSELIHHPDEMKEGGVVLQIKLKELKPRFEGVNTQWSIVPGG